MLIDWGRHGTEMARRGVDCSGIALALAAAADRRSGKPKVAGDGSPVQPQMSDVSAHDLIGRSENSGEFGMEGAAETPMEDPCTCTSPVVPASEATFHVSLPASAGFW